MLKHDSLAKHLIRPSVTIGMPVRNGFPLIKKALDSLLGQRFHDFELVISDNCSEDETDKVCTAYAKADRRIRYFRQDRDLGPMANFEFVLKEARGKLFMWAAHDDVWENDWLTTLVPCVKEDVVMAYGQIRGSDRCTGELTPPIILSFSGASMKRGMTYFMTDERAGKANLIYGLFRKEALNRHKFPKGPRYKFGTDMHIVFTAIQQGSFCYEANTGMSKSLTPPPPTSGNQSPQKLRLIVEIIGYYLGYLRHAQSVLLAVGLLCAIPIKTAICIRHNSQSK